MRDFRKTVNMKNKQLKTEHGINWQIKQIADAAKQYMDKQNKPFLSILDYIEIFKNCGWEKTNE